jgi:uncharacterized membrane protein HdeD (DUF308 family)
MLMINGGRRYCDPRRAYILTLADNQRVEEDMKRAGAVLCIVLGSLVALALAIDLVVSISRKSFDPWWLWLIGVLALGALSIAAGILLWLENRKTE